MTMMEDRDKVFSFLSAHGAPLNMPAHPNPPSLEEALVCGCAAARHFGLLTVVMPYMFFRRRHDVDWDRLRSLASAGMVFREAGLFVAMATAATGDKYLQEVLSEFPPCYSGESPEYFRVPATPFEAELARTRTPVEALERGFYLNATVDDMRYFVRKHDGSATNAKRIA